MKKNFNTRIEQELLDQVAEACKMTGVSKTHIVKEALRKFVRDTKKKSK